MSYDLGLTYPKSGEFIELDEPHHLKGGRPCLGGCPTAEYNITSNYTEHFCRVFFDRVSNHPMAKDGVLSGIRTIYGLTGRESIPILLAAIDQLGDDRDPDYWKATDGNVKRALQDCLILASRCLWGVWDGD